MPMILECAIDALGVLMLLLAVLAFFFPRKCIFAFQKACLFLNWRVEPVDWKRELLALKLLGILLGLLSLIIFFIAFLKKGMCVCG